MTHGKLYLGCAVWSYKGWVGNLYPLKTQPRDFLSLYSQQFNTVEGNTTFYATPQPKTVLKWSQQTRSDFRFCPKLPKEITHQGLLQPKIEQAVSFLQIMSGLEQKLGLVFAQLPPSYSPEYIEDLQSFLTALKSDNVAVEVRHPDWFITPHREKINQMLAQLDITRVLLDTRPIYNCQDDPQAKSQRRKPQLPLQIAVSNQCAMVRFISHPQAEYNRVYLAEWATQVSNWLRKGIDVYFFVHCPIEEHSPNTANSFKSLLEQKGISIENISIKSDPIATQLSLF